MKSPIWWFGGKGHMQAKIVPILERLPHHTYVEPFGGGASILIAKTPAKVEVYNDLDSSLATFFQVLSNPEQFQLFLRKISPLPYSRELYYEYLETWDLQDDPIDRTVQWFYVARQSFAGVFGKSWGFNVAKSSRNMAATVSLWLSAIDNLPQVHSRLQRVQIENKDFRFILQTYDTPETLFYLDPPYVMATRRDGGYKHELSDQDHKDLVQLILNLKGTAVLSGYDSPVYQPLTDKGFLHQKFQTSSHAAARTGNSNLQGKGAITKNQPRTESLFIHPRVAESQTLFTIYQS